MFCFVQFEPNYGDASKEKKRMLNILNRVQSDKPTLDINKAVNQHIAKEQQSRQVYLHKEESLLYLHKTRHNLDELLPIKTSY